MNRPPVMKIVVHVMIILAGAGIGLAAGYALRARPAALLQTTGAGATSVMNSGMFKSNSSFITSAQKNAKLEGSSLVSQLERDLSMSSGVTRWLYWLEALEKATPADCPRLARLAHGNSPLVRLLAARWVELDPQHMFDSIAANQGPGFPVSELQSVLFEEWAKKDVDAVIAALNKTSGPAIPDQWRRNFAVSLIEKDVERGLRLMSEWNVDNYGPRMTAVKKWAAANPRHAAEFARAYPSGYGTRLIMETIGKEWARTDPAGALTFAMGNRDESTTPLANTVLKTWADRNLTEASEWLAKANAETRNYLSPAFVEGWAKYDAASALKWCEGSLTGSAFANAVAGVVKGAAEVDLTGAAALVDSMQPSKARGDAAAVVMNKWMPESMSSKPVAGETIAWLKRLDDESIFHVLSQVEWRWAACDPKGLMGFVSSLKPEEVSPQTYYTLARQLARDNPVEAMAWAQQLPENRRASTAVNVFSEWQQSQPDSARQWFNELPPKDPRREPLFGNVIYQLANDPQGPEHLAALKPADQAAARALIEKMALSQDRREALLGALKPR